MEILNYETKKAVKFIIKYDKQKMTSEQWRGAYFDLLSWKNTWGAYKLDINAGADHKPFVVFIIAKEYTENMMEWLKDIGYKDFLGYETTVCELEMEYIEGIDEYILA